MRAARIVRPGQICLEEIDFPLPDPDELVVRVMASGICGTDIHIFRGEYMGTYPIIPGHEFSGLVEEVGSGVRRFKAGDRIAVEPNISCNNCLNCLNNHQNFCLNWQAVGVTRPGGMAEFAVVPENSAFHIGELSFKEAAFLEPLSCVLHGLEKVNVRMGARVALFGAGPIGILMTMCLKLRGASELTVVERVRSRSDFALDMGADIAVNDMQELAEDSYDVTVDATGSTEVIPQTMKSVRHGGTVLLFGVPPSGKLMEIEPFILFRKGLSLHSSFTSVRNSGQALALLRSGRIRTEKIVSHVLQLDELEGGIRLIESGQDAVRKVLVLPNL